MNTEHPSGAVLVALAAAAHAGDSPSRERVRGAVALALLASGGSLTAAARALGIGRATLHRWLSPPSPEHPLGLDIRAAIAPPGALPDAAGRVLERVGRGKAK